MSAAYTIWLSSPTGERLAVLDSFVRLSYRRVVNRSGQASASRQPLQLVLHAESLPASLLVRDSRLEIWRAPGGAGLPSTSACFSGQELDTETVWLVRSIRKLLDSSGQQLLAVGAVPAIDVLAARLVAYPVGSSQASKTGPADNLMKQIVRENFASDAEAARDLGDWLDIAPDMGLAPATSKQCAWRNVLHVLQELAEAAAEAGTPLYFDIVSPTRERLEFRTYIGTRGSDRTFPDGLNPLVLSPETGTLSSVERSFDYADEYTYVYAGGQGAEEERLIVGAGDSLRSAASPFGRRERLLDARHIADGDALQAEAAANLATGRPRSLFRATVTSNPGSIYGVHWRWGDRVTAAFAGEIFDCHIDEVEVTVEAGQETVRAWLRAEGTPLPSLAEQVARLTSSETETTYQQVQRSTLPASTTLLVPPEGHMLLYGRYAIAGSLSLGSSGRLVILV